MITADFHIIWNHMIIWLSIFFIINQSPVILSWGHQGFLSLRFVMCIGCLVENKVTLFQESKKYWRGYVPTVLCAHCAATMKLLWTLALKQPTLQLRFECCDHGLYIVCSVAGIIFASPLKFSHEMRCRNIFIYLGPITTSVGFHLFLLALWFGRNI